VALSFYLHLPYFVCVSLASLFNGMLNSFGKFAISSGVPMLLNICLIGTMLFFADETLPPHALAWTVLVAGTLQVLTVFIASRLCGIKLSASRPQLGEDVKTLLKRMIPGMVGGGVTQIATWLNTVIATLIPSAVSYLYYADRLVQFPLALIGTAMGTAMLPVLSKAIRNNNKEEANLLQNHALEITLMLCVPAAIALFILAEPLVSLMFERGKFTAEATYQTAQALAIFSFGLPAFAIVKIFAPGFFAAGDTRTPVKIAIFCLALGLTISLSTIHHLEHRGLALATSISTWCNALLLGWTLMRHGRFAIMDGQLLRFSKFIIAALIMGTVLYAIEGSRDNIVMTTLSSRILFLSGEIIAGILIYFAAVRLSGATSFRRIRQLL
jgi:putative peptidoglycan lipid II flippase